MLKQLVFGQGKMTKEAKMKLLDRAYLRNFNEMEMYLKAKKRLRKSIDDQHQKKPGRMENFNPEIEMLDDFSSK